MSVENNEDRMVSVDYNPETLSQEDEQRLKILSEKARELLESNKDVLFLSQVLIGIKRLFATAVASLDRTLEEVELISDKTREQLKAIIISSMSSAAGKPFELGAFARAMNKLLPMFLAKELAYYSKSDDYLHQEDEEQEEEENKEKPATIGPFARGQVYEVFDSDAVACQLSAMKVAHLLRDKGRVVVLDSYKGYRAAAIDPCITYVGLNGRGVETMFHPDTSRVDTRDKLEHLIAHNSASALIIDDLSVTGICGNKSTAPASSYYSVYKFLERLAQDHNIAVIVYRTDDVKDPQRNQYTIKPFEAEFHVDDNDD